MRWILFAALLASTAGGAAQDLSPLEDLMTREEFKAAGLERLSPSERAKLRAWVERYAETGAPRDYKPPRASSMDELRGEHAPLLSVAPDLRSQSETAQDIQHGSQEKRSEVRSRIVGTFNGWSGNTIFELENGQIWQQRHPARLEFHGHAPEVILRRNFMGFYSMEVPVTGRSVLVRQIRP
ncbi:MAG: hypothetical protein JJT88_13905 [Gammaproteobacteria bacterium]|nr:hypothetical protein [Gammaproteobacteria bacterium]